MIALGSTAAIVLSAVMLSASASKLRSLSDAVATFTELGLPRPRLLAPLVAISELVVAAFLLLRPQVGGVAGLAVLSGFTVYLVSLVRSGRQIGCGCFGSSSNEPVSVADVGRNVALLGLAGLAVTAQRMTTPNIQSLIVVTAGSLIVLVVAQLVTIYRQTGSLFRIELAGEHVADLQTVARERAVS